MSKDSEHNDNNNSSNSSHSKAEKREDVRSIAAEENNAEDKVEGDTEAQSDSDTTGNLEDEDFSEDISKEDKETIKKVANDDNFSQAKSYASILVEQVMDARETFERSLGSLFTSAFTAGLEIGISFFMILSAFALLSGVLPSHYAIVLASLLYPIGFIIVVIGQSLLFTEQTSLLSLPVLNKIEPLHKLLRLWGIVIAGNVVGGCLFAHLHF